MPNLFVVPAYNEEANLPRLFADLESRPALFPPGSRLLIVDDGSQDDTAAIVDRYSGPLPAEVIRLGRNQGPGAAFRAGFAAALEKCDGEALVVTLEADTTSDLDALPEMIRRAYGGAELVLASWVMVNVSRFRRILSEGAAKIINRILGVEAKTVSSFYRVYRASTLRAAAARYGDALIREPGFACKAELLSKLASMSVRIEEVDVGLDTSKRVGDSKMPVLRTIFHYWRLMARQRLARDPIAA
ncbi:MAG TPA: glycosyltransferase family 2 protein [Gaiellaceae bacterium]|nr:glycosyltransferase family 2 protein [Gaiellaceae bacterium]